MLYEIHVTVNTADTETFKNDCKSVGVKPIVIETENADNLQRQVMTSSKHTGDRFEDQLNSIYTSFNKLGYQILREKVEIMPSNEKHRWFKYYETHIRLKLPKNSDRAQVLSICKIFNFHLSKNLFKTDDNFDYQMIMKRVYAGPLKAFTELIEIVKSELNDYKIEFDKVEIEECIYDSKESIDNSWLLQK